MSKSEPMTNLRLTWLRSHMIRSAISKYLPHYLDECLDEIERLKNLIPDEDDRQAASLSAPKVMPAEETGLDTSKIEELPWVKIIHEWHIKHDETWDSYHDLARTILNAIQADNDRLREQVANLQRQLVAQQGYVCRLEALLSTAKDDHQAIEGEKDCRCDCVNCVTGNHCDCAYVPACPLCKPVSGVKRPVDVDPRGIVKASGDIAPRPSAVEIERERLEKDIRLMCYLCSIGTPFVKRDPDGPEEPLHWMSTGDGEYPVKCLAAPIRREFEKLGLPHA